MRTMSSTPTQDLVDAVAAFDERLDERTHRPDERFAGPTRTSRSGKELGLVTG